MTHMLICSLCWYVIFHTLHYTLQHAATHCNTLQHTATHCNTLLICYLSHTPLLLDWVHAYQWGDELHCTQGKSHFADVEWWHTLMHGVIQYIWHKVWGISRMLTDVIQMTPHTDATQMVCCSVLQCVFVCCSVLQCAAVCCSVRHFTHVKWRHTHDATHWCHPNGVLQCVAVCCSVLQCVAACCSVLQCEAFHAC